MIECAVGGRIPRHEEPVPTVVTINDNSFTLNMASGTQITGANVNIGSGTQINVRADSDRTEVLTTAAALVRAGLTGDWNAAAARELAALIENRDDIAFTDVEKVTAEVVGEEAPTQARARELLEQVTSRRCRERARHRHHYWTDGPHPRSSALMDRSLYSE